MKIYNTASNFVSRIVTISLLILLPLPLVLSQTGILNGISARANSAWTECLGTDATGAIVTEEDCPLVVEHETLTFDIPEYPASYYYSTEEFLEYQGRVTAEYSFYNPAEYAVEATLVFPFGTVPGYGGSTWYRMEDRSLLEADVARYQVSVDGEAIDRTLRYTYSYDDAQFALDTDLGRLHDGYVEDAFYAPDLPVTKYTFAAEGITYDRYSTEEAAFVIAEDATKTKVFFVQQDGEDVLEEGVRVYGRAINSEFVLYVLGEPLSEMPQWKFYEDAYCEKEVSGEMVLRETESLTFQDLVFSDYRESDGISESDWYNAFVEQMHRYEIPDGFGALDGLHIDFNIIHELMRWYEYSIKLEAGERMTNTVIAPMYPAIWQFRGPAEYTYTYLLSPAKIWADFGDLDIQINTPFALTETSLGDFEVIEKDGVLVGHRLSLDGLPDDELIFQIIEEDQEGSSRAGEGSSVDDPGGEDGLWRDKFRGTLGIFGILIGTAVILLGGIIVLLLLIVKIIRWIFRKLRGR